MSRIYALLIVKVYMRMLGNPWNLVIHIHGNELRQIHLIIGAPHRINPSLIIKNFVRCVSIHGRIYAFLFEHQSDGVLLFNEKYVNYSVYKLKD